MEKINLESLLNLESLGQGKATKVLRKIYIYFEEPLRSAGFMDNLDNLLEQRDAIIEDAVNTLNPSRTSYLKVWYNLLNSQTKSNWLLPPLFLELLFALPIS